MPRLKTISKHSIYRIVNFINGKSYIGQTNRPKIRKAEHFVRLEKNKHWNNHLQHAFNEYGAEFFYFEVLEGNISSSEVDQREIYWIEEISKDHELYNIAPGGVKPGIVNRQPMMWNGIEYPSIGDVQLATGHDRVTLGKYKKLGYTCDADVPPNKRHKTVIWNGIQYPTIADAARANGLSYYAMWLRIENGFYEDSQVVPIAKAITWNGIEYPSIVSAALANNIGREKMQRYIKRGLKSDQDAKNFRQAYPSSKKVIWNDVEYKTITDAAKANNVSASTMLRWLKKRDSK